MVFPQKPLLRVRKQDQILLLPFLMMLLNNPACVLQTKNLSAEQLIWLCLGFIAFSFTQFRVTGLVLGTGPSPRAGSSTGCWPSCSSFAQEFLCGYCLSLWRAVFNLHSFMFLFGLGSFGFLWLLLVGFSQKKKKVSVSFTILIIFHFWLVHFAKILQCFIHAI